MSQENSNILERQFATEDSSAEQLFISEIEGWLLGDADINSLFLANGYTALHHAAQNGYVRAINIFIERGANIHATFLDSGYTALHFAAACSHGGAISALIRQGAAINMCINTGETALEIAALIGNPEVINAFVADRDKSFTALHFAAVHRDAGAIRALISDADVTACLNTGETALEIAALIGNPEVINAFIVGREGNGFTVLHFAALHGDAGAIRALIARADININAPFLDNGTTPLYIAAKNGHVEAVKALIKGGAIINILINTIETALQIAVETENPDVINAFVVDPEDGVTPLHTPLHFAILHRDLGAVNTLIEKGRAGINMPSNGYRALHLAILCGDVNIIKTLIEKGKASIKIRDNDGLSALHLAAKHGDVNVIKTLIELAPTEVDIVTLEGFSALYFAVERGDVNIIKTLIAKHAKTDIVTKQGFSALYLAVSGENLEIINAFIIGREEGFTVLHLAAENGDVGAIQKLIERGVNVDARDINGSTALHIAAQNGRAGVIKILIAKGAKLEINNKGATALEIAAKKGNLEDINAFIVGREAGFTALHLAALNKDLGAIQKLIDVFGDINAPLNSGHTALHVAASVRENVDVINTLIARGANVEATIIDRGNTPLHIAVETENLDAIEVLIARGAKVNATLIGSGHTSLHIAVVLGNIDVINALLAKDANVNATLIDIGHTPLHIAVEKGNIPAINALLAKGANVDASLTDSNRYTPLHFAVILQNIHAIKALIAKGAGVHMLLNSVKTALEIAVETGYVEGINVFIVGREVGFTALHLAAERRDVGAINVLLKATFSNINAPLQNGRTALHIAVGEGNIGIIKALLAKGANIEAYDTKGFTPLHTAAYNGHTLATNALMAGGANIEARDFDGFTPLHWAAFSRDPGPLLQLMMEGKAKVNVVNKSGFTPLHFAAKGGNALTIEILIGTGADVHAASDSKHTALHIAAEYGNVEAILELIKARANVNITTATQHTALHVAAEKGHLDIIKLLLANGAQVNAASASKHTALHSAAQNGHLVVMQELIKAGANVNAAVKNFTAFHQAAARGHIDFAIKEWEARGSNITENLSQALHLAGAIKRKDSITLLLQELNKLNLIAKSTFLLSVSPSFLLKMSAHDFLESISEILKKKKTIDFSQYNKQLVSFIEDQIKSIMAPSKTTSSTDILEQILHILFNPNPNIKLLDNVTITPNILRGDDFEKDIKILQFLVKYDRHFRCELTNMAIYTWDQHNKTKDKSKEGRILDTFKLFKSNEVDWGELFTKIVDMKSSVAQSYHDYLYLFKEKLENTQFINVCKKYIISAQNIRVALMLVDGVMERKYDSKIVMNREEMKDEDGNTIWHWFVQNPYCKRIPFDSVNISLNTTNNAGETVFARMIKCQDALKIANIIDSNWDLIVDQNVDVNQHTTDGECALTKLAKDLTSVWEIKKFIFKCKPSGELFFNINQIDTSESAFVIKRVIDYIAQHYKHGKNGIDINFINDLRKCGSLEPQILMEGLGIANLQMDNIHGNNNDSNSYNLMNMLYARYPLSPQEINKAIADFKKKQSNIPFAKRVDKCVDALLKWHSANPPHVHSILQRSGIDLTQPKETLVKVIIARCNRESNGVKDNIRQFLQEIFALSITESNILGNPLEIYHKLLHGNIAWTKHDSAVNTVCMVVNALIGEYNGHGYTMGPNTKVPLSHSATKTIQTVIVDFKKLVGTMIHVINQTPDLMVNNLYIEGTQVRLEDMFIYCLSDLEHCFSGQLMNLMSVIQPVLLAEEERYLDNAFTPQFIQFTSQLINSVMHRFPDISQKAILAWIYDMSTDSIQPQEWCGFTQVIHGTLNALIISQNIAQGDKSCPFKGILRRMLKFSKDIIQSYRNKDIENAKDIIQSCSDKDSLEDKVYTTLVSIGVDIMCEGISCVATEWCTSTVSTILDGKSIEAPNIYCASLAFGEFATVGIDVFLHAIGRLPKNEVAEFLVLLIDNFILSHDVEKELIRLEKIFKQQYNSSIAQDVSGEENLDPIAAVENVQEDVEATGADTHTESAI